MLSILVVVALVLVVFRARINTALVALLISGHLDFSGPEFDTQDQLGYLNIAKIVLPVSILALRMGLVRARWSSGAWLLSAFLLSLGLGLTTTDFMLPLVKLWAYILTYALIAFVCLRFRQTGRQLSSASIAAIVVVPYTLAIAQTYVLGGIFGTADGRFTSFASPNEFSLYYVGVVAFLLGNRGIGWFKLLGVALSVGAILQAGSRAALMVVLVFLFLWCLYRFAYGTLMMSGIASISLLILLAAGLVVAQNPSILGQGRSTEAIQNILSGSSDLEKIGTFRFRANVADEASQTLKNGNFAQLAFGHGYGTAAEVTVDAGAAATLESIDPNRAVHNEFLRIALEQGAFGLVTLYGAFIGFVALLWRQAVSRLAIVLSIVGIAVGLMTENLLVGSGGASGWGLMFGLTSAASSTVRVIKRNPEQSAESRK